MAFLLLCLLALMCATDVYFGALYWFEVWWHRRTCIYCRGIPIGRHWVGPH